MKSLYVSNNDHELLAASREGDEAAFRLLFEKYWDDLFKIALRRLYSADDAKDVLQDVFLSFWNNIHNITLEESLGGYLYTALRNKIFNHLEKNSKRLHTLLQHPFTPAECEETVFSRYTTKELEHYIKKQVSNMPEKMRRIYVLSREEHMSNADIASLLNLSNQTVKNQLHHALTRLRKNLENSPFHPFTSAYILFLLKKFL
ncbi:MAG: RNA polymerase sigma-70 factor [Chitinophagaceae bacterium]|nr:RNA polymerase sigma-70 factor [Chitinophagaceae bacterium]MCW5927754.1 RNA polymerase sigma-70 factor [Chitinophagaceae bacterium]